MGQLGLGSWEVQSLLGQSSEIHLHPFQPWAQRAGFPSLASARILPSLWGTLPMSLLVNPLLRAVWQKDRLWEVLPEPQARLRIPPLEVVRAVPMGKNYYTHFTEEKTWAQREILMAQGCVTGVRAGTLTLQEAWCL